MECREVRRLLDAYVSEQLQVETTDAIAEHVERCAGCREELEGLRRLRQATRAAFERATAPGARPEFAAALRTHLERQAERRSPARWRWAVAASVVLVAALGFAVREWSTSIVEALVHAAVGDHRNCALEFKLAERPIPLDEAARRFGGVTARFVGVEPTTDTLPGGPIDVVDRHSCVFDGHRFVHIVFRYRSELVSLLVPINPRPLAARIWTRPLGDEIAVVDGVRVAAFGGSRHLAFLVSSLSGADLQDVVQAVSPAVSRALAGA